MKQCWKRSLAALAATLVLGSSGLAVSAQTPALWESPVYSADWKDAALLLQGEFAQAKERIYQGLQNHQDEIAVSGLGLTTENAFDVYVSVVKEHPELFFPKAQMSYSYTLSGEVVSLQPRYYYSAQEIPAMQQEIDQVVDQIKAMTDGLSEFDQLLVIHDWLAERMTYDFDVASSSELTSGRTAYDALVRHQGVCEAYDFGFRLLANALGFETSYAKTAGHIWSMVKLDGEWYHVDVTHDDPSFSGENGTTIPTVPGLVSHSYFLVSDAAVQDSGHGYGNFEAANTASSTRFDGDALFFRNWTEYPDGAAVSNGRVYFASGGALYAGSQGQPVQVETGLLYVSSAASFSQPGLGLILTGYQSLEESEGLYRLDENGLEKLADLSQQAYFNDPRVMVWCSYLQENSDGTASVYLSSTLSPQFLQTVVTLPASSTPDPHLILEPEPCEHPNLTWEITAAPTADADGILWGVCPDCGEEWTKELPYGDLDLDGKVSVLDVMTLAQVTVSNVGLTEGLDGDYNGDGAVNVLDVMVIARMILPD